jgi:hypothetical protein
MNIPLPASSAASTTTPARCGSSASQLIPCWHDKHPLTCDNDTMDSWEDGWIRQPPAYQESLHLPTQHADQRPEQTASLHKPIPGAEGSLPSRNTGQIQFSGVSDTSLPFQDALPNGGYFACSASAADAERDCRGRSDSWHGGLTNEPGPLPGSRNLANHGAPIDAYYATSRQAKVRYGSAHATDQLPDMPGLFTSCTAGSCPPPSALPSPRLPRCHRTACPRRPGRGSPLQPARCPPPGATTAPSGPGEDDLPDSSQHGGSSLRRAGISGRGRAWRRPGKRAHGPHLLTFPAG